LKSEWPVYRSSSDIKSRSASKTAFCREHRQCSTDGELQCKILALLTDIKDCCADFGVTLNGSKDHNESKYYFKSKRKQVFPRKLSVLLRQLILEHVILQVGKIIGSIGMKRCGCQAIRC